MFQSELRRKNEQVNSIQCEFTQTREVSILANPVSKTGTFYFVKPGNMLLAFHDGDFIKMTSQWFEMKTGSNVTTTSVTSNPMLRSLSSILSACVVGDFNKMSSGFAVSYKQQATEWVITLTPQRGKAASKISSIVISFDKRDMSLNELKMVEKSGDYTAYRFTKKQFNVAVDSKLFNVSK
jgi:outer membrane lipoprotein-sorting protein